MVSYPFIRGDVRMITNTDPVAVFDSGVGGISVLKELVRVLPHEDFLYFGDSANAPYGGKTQEQVCDLTIKHVARLIDRGSKAVVIACNTATSAAVEPLRRLYPDIPIVGMEPALKPAVFSGDHPRVLVMATTMTLRLDKFNRLLDKYQSYGEINLLPCPGLARRIEAGMLDGEEIESFLRELMKDYLENPVDTVVLGCTHYPFVRPVLRRILGDGVKIMDGSAGTARELKRRLKSADLLNDDTHPGSVTFENSRDTEEELTLCERLYQQTKSKI
jgi:glutamate racemase